MPGTLVRFAWAGENRGVTTVASLYGPVAEDLQLVEDTLDLTAQTDFLPLQEMLQSVLSRGGKRLRPAIALLSGGFGEYDAQNQVLLATSIELLHTATLVHDDVIDASETRRGQPTANASFDNAATVMLGDYMFAHAAELVARTSHVGVIRLFAQTLKTMATGELRQDINAYDAESASMRDYYARIYGKTASLFETAGTGGALMSGATPEVVSALGEYGRCLGMAFQIVDDVLDFTATAAELGKPVGGDLLAGTLTLPSILLMEEASGGDVVRRLFASEDEGERESLLAEALGSIRAGDILERSQATALEWQGRAVASLEGLTSPSGRGNPQREALEGIAAFVVSRKF
ncbi:MAG: heptaprenyl diphosphate synthase/octaprenyl-diphosphate synthase [Chloroflexi bacterium]|nr:MAG: heptaprenyl diphosphate synthase/octaprenyl-diphosphate synthase [Chloroflexota bacterium]